jgi:hypothetical protein
MVMAKKQPFTLVYADEIKEHLRAIETKKPNTIPPPDVETRNRKPLKRLIAFGADWELRLRAREPIPCLLPGQDGKPRSSCVGSWR